MAVQQFRHHRKYVEPSEGDRRRHMELAARFRTCAGQLPLCLVEFTDDAPGLVKKAAAFIGQCHGTG